MFRADSVERCIQHVEHRAKEEGEQGAGESDDVEGHAEVRVGKGQQQGLSVHTYTLKA